MSKVNWTEEEIDFLRKAYREGLSLKEMGYFLKRSVTAVNKALYRFSVRKKESRLKKTIFSKSEMRDQVMQSIRDISRRRSQNIEFLTSEKLEQRDYFKGEAFIDLVQTQKNGSLEVFKRSICQGEDLYEEGAYNGFSSSCERVKKKKIPYRHLEKFVFFEDVLSWLVQRGFTIEKIQQDFFLGDPPQMSEVLYKITSSLCEKETPHSFKTEAQLLLFANKVRLKESLPLFYVFDVTAE